MSKLPSLSRLLYITKNCKIASLCFNVKRNLQVSSSLNSGSLPPMPHILKENQIPESERLRIEKEVEELTKDWVSVGFHDTDKREDLFRYNLLTCLVFSMLSSCFLLVLWYSPNRSESEWARREAFLELERRRRDGLPLISRDLIPPDRVKLPSDEELGSDFKIII